MSNSVLAIVAAGGVVVAGAIFRFVFWPIIKSFKNGSSQ